jgi:hypothetical protein
LLEPAVRLRPEGSNELLVQGRLFNLEEKRKYHAARSATFPKKAYDASEFEGHVVGLVEVILEPAIRQSGGSSCVPTCHRGFLKILKA